MSHEGPEDLSALDALISRHGQGPGTSAGNHGLSASRRQEILTGKHEEQVDPTHETLKALINYEETIPDQEVDEFVAKIKDTRLLDDYDNTNPHSIDPTDSSPTPAYNPWPLDEDSPSPAMADPLSGDIMVTDLSSPRDPKVSKLQNGSTEPEKEGEETAGGISNGLLSSLGDAEDAAAASMSNDVNDDDDEAEDLTEEFRAEVGGGDGSRDISSDCHSDVEIVDVKEDVAADDSEEWEMIPRVDDDVDGGGEGKDSPTKEMEAKDNLREKEGIREDEENNGNEEEEQVKEEQVEEEQVEEEEVEEEEEIAVGGMDEKDSLAEAKVTDVHSNTDNSSKAEEESLTAPDQEDQELAEVTEVDGQSSPGEKEHTTPAIHVTENSQKDDIPDFETFLAEMGVSTLDVEAQKSRARLSRVGPLATRRPITKRFSGDEEKQNWMFVDSTEPKARKASIEEDEEEEERTSRAPPPQLAAKPSPGAKRPPGGLALGMGAMKLPGLSAALGGAKLRKTPISSPGKSLLDDSTASSPSQAEATKAVTPSPLQTSPHKVLPGLGKVPPKPPSRPKPQAQPGPTSQEPAQPAWMKELKQRSPRKQPSEGKSMGEPKEESEKAEKGLNSDILHPAAPSELKDAEPQKTPPWLANSKAKKLPPIGTSKVPRKEEETSATPPWKQELIKKKKAPIPTPGAQKTPSKAPPQPSAKPPAKPAAKPIIPKKPSPAKPAEKKRAGDRIDGADETDSKKILLTPSVQANIEEKMNTEESTLAPKQENAESREEPKEENGEPKAEKESNMEAAVNEERVKGEEKKEEEIQKGGEEKKEEKMEHEEEKTEVEDVKETEKEIEEGQGEEVNVVKTEEIKMKVIQKPELKKEEVKPPPIKQDELTVKIVPKSKEQSKNLEGEKENIGLGTEGKKTDKPDKKYPAKPNDKPKLAQKPQPAERPKLVEKPVQIIPKTNAKKEEAPRSEKSAEVKKVTIVRKSSELVNEGRAGEKSSATVLAKNNANKEGSGGEQREKEGETAPSSMPKWKREALERKQKRKMSGGYAPLHKPGGRETIENNNTPQWKKDLMEKRRLIPRMPSMDSAEKEEKGSKDPLTSEKKRHTIAADAVSVPSHQKTGTPTWKQELEQKKNARLAKHLEIKDAGPEIQTPSDQSAETVAAASS